MVTIIVEDFEVFYRVGVPDSERAEPQRLLLRLEMAHDFTAAAATDDLAQTIDYFALTRRLLVFGAGRSWKLIERLAADLAELVLTEFGAQQVTVEVKKFVLLIAYGITSRVIAPLKERFSLFRPIRIYPVLEEELQRITSAYRHVIVVEGNDGQYASWVECTIHRRILRVPCLGGSFKLGAIRHHIEEGIRGAQG